EVVKAAAAAVGGVGTSYRARVMGPGPKSPHGQAGDSTSCDTEVSRSHAPPPPSPPGTRSRRLPRTPAPTNGTSTRVDEPAASSGRDRGNATASGPAPGVCLGPAAGP